MDKEFQLLLNLFRIKIQCIYLLPYLLTNFTKKCNINLRNANFFELMLCKNKQISNQVEKSDKLTILLIYKDLKA